MFGVLAFLQRLPTVWTGEFRVLSHLNPLTQRIRKIKYKLLWTQNTDANSMENPSEGWIRWGRPLWCLSQKESGGVCWVLKKLFFNLLILLFLNPNFISSAEGISLIYGEIFGLIGGALTTFGYVPQVVRILKLKSAREISLPFTLSFLTGAICWLAYGVLLSLMPVILWNSAGIVFLCMLLYGKLKYGR